MTQATPASASPRQGLIAAEHALRLAEEEVQLRRQALTAAAGSLTDEEDIAWAYWHMETVSVESLGAACGLNAAEVLAIAQRYPGWEWTCPRCTKPTAVRSRTDLRERRTKARQGRSHAPLDLCPECKPIATAQWHQELAERNDAQQKRLQQLHTMPYRQYLQTPEWQNQRRARLRSARYRCQVCNNATILHVHHRTYERRGYEYAADLIVLCDDCHALYHRVGKLPAHEEGD